MVLFLWAAARGAAEGRAARLKGARRVEERFAAYRCSPGARCAVVG